MSKAEKALERTSVRWFRTALFYVTLKTASVHIDIMVKKG